MDLMHAVTMLEELGSTDANDVGADDDARLRRVQPSSAIEFHKDGNVQTGMENTRALQSYSRNSITIITTGKVELKY